MLIKRRKDWEIPEIVATPEVAYFSRRRLLHGAGAVMLTTALSSCDNKRPSAAASAPDPTADLYPAKRDPAYKLDRAITPENAVTTYNNYYEFGTSKDIADDAQMLPIRPWTVSFEGMVEKPFTIGIDDLIRKMPLEERLYRHRCVEAWAMAVPWTGFALSKLIALAKPLSGATFVEMQTFMKPDVADGQNQSFYPWPYTEGLTMAEAMNELAFLATGLYGKPLAKQNGSPLRLAVPWKYGFKSIKGIVRFKFTTKRPTTYWEALGPTEYGFWANVNPDVAHPRWSQASEELIGTASERVLTKIFNGYGAQVASLYKGMNIGDALFR